MYVCCVCVCVVVVVVGDAKSFDMKFFHTGEDRSEMEEKGEDEEEEEG